MKKILSIVCLVVIVVIFAAGIGYTSTNYKSNIFASTVSVTSTNPIQRLDLDNLGIKTREITVINGSTNEVYVDFTKSTTDAGKTTIGSSTKGCIIDGDKVFTLRDFVSGGMTIIRAGADASPVSVIISY